MRKSLLAVATLLALAASASAHVTATVDPLAAPLVVGVPTTVTVHLSEPCAEVVPQELQGQDTVAVGLMPDSSTTITGLGETVPFASAQCDPTAVPLALVRADAKLTLTAGPNAPGLTNLTLLVTSYLGGGATPGASVGLAATVAYFANATLVVGPTMTVGNLTTVPVRLTYAANAATRLTLAATASTGKVSGLPAGETLFSPAASNKTTLTRSWNATFTRDGAKTADLTFIATLAPKAGGAAAATVTKILTIPGLVGASASTSPAVSSKTSPLPLPFLALVGAALVASRRRFA